MPINTVRFIGPYGCYTEATKQKEVDLMILFLIMGIILYVSLAAIFNLADKYK